MITVNSSESRGSSVCIVIRIRAGRSGVRIPMLSLDFFAPPDRPDRLWSPPSFLFNGYWGLKRPECEVNHLRLSSAKVKGWSPTCFPPICLYRVEKGNITFTFVNNWELHD
jgi:hypothetical protein